MHSMSGCVGRGARARLEEKIQATKHQGASTERDRQVSLLERQRQAVTDLLTRRQLVADQLESCVLAMQNVRFDCCASGPRAWRWPSMISPVPPSRPARCRA